MLPRMALTGDQRVLVKRVILDALRRTTHGAIELTEQNLGIPTEAIAEVLEELCKESNGALSVTKWPSGALALSRTNQLQASLSEEGKRVMAQAGLIFGAGDVINTAKPKVSPDPNITPEDQAEYDRKYKGDLAQRRAAAAARAADAAKKSS